MSYDRNIYEKAEAEIKRRRYHAENEQQKKLNKLKNEIPEIEEIYGRLSQTIIEISKMIISHKDNFEENFEHIREKNLQAQQMICDLLLSYGYPEDYLEVHYTCQKCSDKGVDDDGMRCSCFINLLNKYSIDKLNEDAQMPDCDFNHFSLEYYRGIKMSDGSDCIEYMSNVYTVCKNYADSFSSNSESLLLFGKTGVGKTHLSLAIGKTVAEKGYTVAYGSIINYLDKIEKEHFGKTDGEKSDTIEILTNTELLILDDLGSEFEKSFYESVIYNIINCRINLGRPTIINTNLSMEELQRKYNERIISRIFGTYKILRFMGEDIRQLKRLKEYS